MSDTGTLININGVNFYAGMSWEHESHHHALLFSFKIKRIAEQAGLHYGTSIEEGKSDGQKKCNFQYALCHKPQAEGKVFSGAQFIAEHITKWIPNHKEKTIVFIKSIENTDGAFGERSYWVCATSHKGHVIGEFDTIVKDRFNLISQIENITITEDVVFAILDSEAEIKADIYSYSDRAGITREEVSIDLIEQPIFQRIARNYDKPIKRLHKDSAIKTEKIGLASFAIAGVVSVFFAYSYLTQATSIMTLSDTDRIKEIEVMTRDYSNTLQSLKGSSKWTPEEYRKSTLEEFIDDMKYHLYSPLNASLIMREINRSLPRFSVEWEMKSIDYVDSRFLVTYERIENSKGVYFLLDEKIDYYQMQNNGLYISPFSLNKEATKRVYIVKPNMSLAAQFESEEMLSNLRGEAKAKSQYQRAVKRTKDEYDRALDVHRKYESLTFSQKWITMETKSLADDFKKAIAKAESLAKKASKVERKMSELTPLELDESLILGDIMDFVTMLQLDSLFDWTYPEVSHTYPSQESLEKRSVSKSKSKKKRSDDEYGPAIETYKVVISTLSSEEEGKIKSYGMSDMISLGVLIDKPYIHTHNIFYDKSTDQWEFTIHFNKKTSEYDRRFSGVVNNKEVNDENI